MPQETIEGSLYYRIQENEFGRLEAHSVINGRLRITPLPDPDPHRIAIAAQDLHTAERFDDPEHQEWAIQVESYILKHSQRIPESPPEGLIPVEGTVFDVASTEALPILQTEASVSA